MRILQLSAFLILAALAFAGTGRCLEAEDVLRLKSAGFEDATLQALIEEQSIATAAVSVEELLRLKENGISEETMRMLIRKASFVKNRQTVVYGEALETIHLTTVSDLIRLKQAGLSDEAIQALLRVLGSGGGTDADRAWEMLDHLGIRIDTRSPP